MKKILILSMAFVLVFSNMALAANENITKIESNPDIGFIKEVGVIQKTEESETGIRAYFVANGSEEVSWILLLSDNSIVVEGKNGKIIKASELKKDQKVELFYRKNTPVLQSYPGQFSPTVIFIPEENGYFADVDFFGKEGNGHENRLVIKPSEKTVVTDFNNKKVDIKDLEDKELIVLYKESTRSIPPQTTPEKIYVLNDDSKEIQHEIKLSGNSVTFTLEPISQNGEKLYPVRQIFENGGGKVEWNDETKVITIKLGEEVININTVEKTAKIKDKEILLKGLTIMDGRTFASAELFK